MILPSHQMYGVYGKKLVALLKALSTISLKVTKLRFTVFKIVILAFFYLLFYEVLNLVVVKDAIRLLWV